MLYISYEHAVQFSYFVAYYYSLKYFFIYIIYIYIIIGIKTMKFIFSFAF